MRLHGRTLGTVAAGLRRRWERATMAVGETSRYLLGSRDPDLLKRFEEGFAERNATPAEPGSDRDLLRRLVRAYRLAKEAQESVPEPYGVGPLWEGMLRRNFAELTSALNAEDLDGLDAILARFHRSRCSLWAGGSYEDFEAARASRLYRYSFLNSWRRYERAYREAAGEDAPLEYSQVGLPVGLMCHGAVIPLEALRYHYWAVEIRRLLEGAPRPTICEIGGGLGGQTYKVVSTWGGPLTYAIFDIPEMLVLSSYFLLRSLPGRRTLLFGEGGDDAALGSHDLILMPNFVLPQLPDSSVDLFFNSCSFSELWRETTLAYLAEVERCTRGWFLHINHTARFSWQVNGGTLTNLPADELIPDPELFELMWRRKRPFARAEDRIFLRRHRAGHLACLYRRRAAGSEEARA